MAERIVNENTFYVRYAETDAMGIVHHASYIVYFEEGRSNYARQRGSDYASFERSGHYLTVAEVNARYLKPAVYGQRITVRCWIEEMKSRSADLRLRDRRCRERRSARHRHEQTHLHHPRRAGDDDPRRMARMGGTRLLRVREIVRDDSPHKREDRHLISLMSSPRTGILTIKSVIRI